MVFTAVLAAIAVIAAMVAVPGGKAEAAPRSRRDSIPSSATGSQSSMMTRGLELVTSCP